MASTRDGDSTTEVKPTYDELLAKVARFEQQQQRNKSLTFLNTYSTTLAAHPHERLAAFAVDSLKEFTGAAAVLISDYDASASELVVSASTLAPDPDSAIRRLLGRSIVGFRSPVGPDTYREITANTVGVSQSLHEVTFGAIPRMVGGLIEKALGIVGFTGIALMKDGQLVGTIVIVASDATMQLDHDFLSSFGNITANVIERRRSDQALRESEERYKALFDRSLELVCIHDFEGRFVDANDAALRLLGYDRKEIPSVTFASLLSEDQLPLAVATTREIAETGSQQGLTEYKLGRKDGSCVYVETKGSAVLSNGVPVAVQMIGRDITERKRAEEALRESQAQLREAHRLASIGVWDWDAASDTVNWTEELFRIAGRDPEQPAPSYVEHPKVYTPESWRRLKTSVERALETGDSYQLELELVRPDGTLRWVNAFGGARHAPNGQVMGLHGTVQDITERKRAEDELRRSVDLLDATGQMAKVGGWELDLATREVSWTDEVCRIHGVEPGHRPKLDEAVSFFAPESRPALEAAIKRCAATGEPWDLESLFIPAGSKDAIWVRSLGKAVYGGGKIERLTGTFQNIDEDKRAEAALRDSHKRFQALVETTSDFIWEMDARGAYTYCSPQLETLWGLQPKEMLGKSPFDLLPLEEREQAIGGFQTS